MDEITINSVMNYDNSLGLTISSKGEILEDLISLTKIAYGEDYVIEQGNEWYSFLDLLAGSLAEVGGATQKLYNTLSFTGAAGTNLDNVVSFVGITRKAEQNSTVLIKATIDQNSAIERPYILQIGEITLQDSNNNKWINTSILSIEKYKNIQSGSDQENYVGTATFVATDENTDPTNIVLNPYNNGTNTDMTIITQSIPSGITFINEVGSSLGNQEETDAQLRARYKKELYKESIGTTDGLIAQVENNADVNYCHIIENNSSETAANGMTPHSIWTIVDGQSSWDGTGTYSTDDEDIKIAQTILSFESLGCGTSIPTAYQNYNASTGEGQIAVQITIDSTTYDIKFSRASKKDCYVAITLDSTIGPGTQRDSIEYQIRQNIGNYINNLGIGNDVLNSGLSSAVFAVVQSNDYKDLVIDIDTLFVNTTVNPVSGKRITVAENEYPTVAVDSTDIAITWNLIS